uniref:Uncharacterized protein n=1 Tax=Timema genevievae TaxID=629358 RepID=A0A7R9K9Q1_TIMGE|nr:unnamed protein product [Timema genevievae]
MSYTAGSSTMMVSAGTARSPGLTLCSTGSPKIPRTVDD